MSHGKKRSLIDAIEEIMDAAKRVTHGKGRSLIDAIVANKLSGI